MSKLEYKFKDEAETSFIHLSGQIDETFPADLLNANFKNKVVIDLDQIKMINSVGIRKWIQFMGQLKDKKVELFKCPKIFIDQVNMVQDFILPNFLIASFYVPYFMEEKGIEENVLYKLGQDYGDSFLNVQPEIKNPDGAILEIDVIEHKYFKFLKSIN